MSLSEPRGQKGIISQLRSLLRERPLVAYGGIGSLIYQRLGYPRALCIEHTPLTHAETVLQIHLAYIAAGAALVAVVGVLSATHDSPVRPVASPAHIQMTAPTNEEREGEPGEQSERSPLLGKYAQGTSWSRCTRPSQGYQFGAYPRGRVLPETIRSRRCGRHQQQPGRSCH
jgi:hypothetical protein